jgi:hypothetical protein
MTTQDPGLLVVGVTFEKFVESLSSFKVLFLINSNFRFRNKVTACSSVLDILKGNVSSAIYLSMKQEIDKLKEN